MLFDLYIAGFHQEANGNALLVLKKIVTLDEGTKQYCVVIVVGECSKYLQYY